MPPTDINVGFGTPWAAQIDFLRNKLDLPTERWDDIQKSAHDRAFIVAGATKADLLSDLHQAVIDAASNGGGLRQFRKDFASIVAKNGWTGWTGEGTKAGEAWRTKVIFQTNMATSYAAGRYQQLMSDQARQALPYWRYIHSDNVVHPRPLHLSWHGVTLPNDHPFWKTHFAPNGWGCHCRIVGVSRREGEASTRAGLGAPPDGWDHIDPKTGAPVGIDKGFDYAPGASVAKSFKSFIDDKLIRLDAPIGAAMWQELEPVMFAERLAAWQALFDTTRASMQASGTTVMVQTIDPATIELLLAEGVVLENAAVWMRDTELLHALRDYKADRGATLPDAVWRDLPQRLANADVYLDTKDQALIYAIDLGDQAGKVVVQVNYNLKGRFEGTRARIVSNFVQTGGLVNYRNLGETRYVPLKK